MCGIAGVFAYSNGDFEITEDYIIKMRDAMIHRGPDSGGLWISSDRKVGLGQRRLSIIDLSAVADQPICNEDGSLWVVFNGEIYNHADIRKELMAIGGHAWKTDHSDTEMILHAFEQWGIECIKKFSGMFAMAIFDCKNKRMFLVRDRLGKKPLYYIDLNGIIFFASEIHAFFKMNIIKKEINTQAVYDYLTFLTVNAPNTFYKNVNKLEAGHYIEILNSKVRKTGYWNIADYLNEDRNVSIEEAERTTENLLEISMKYRNISDAPVSIALSGGLDSSLNLHYSSKWNSSLKAITLSYIQKSQYDESEVARRYSNELGIEYINESIDKDKYKKLINEYSDIQKDMPIGDLNAPLIYLLSKISRSSNSKVLIVGEGGDEIGGYPAYESINKKIIFYKFLLPLFKRLKCILPERISGKYDFCYEGKIISPRHIHGFTENAKKKFWIGAGMKNSYRVLLHYMNEISDTINDSFLRKISNIEYKLRLPEMILSRIDYPSMAASIEARSPFMDHKLIEYSSSLSFTEIKMKSGPKTLLKKIAKKKLPEYIMNHPKIGLGMLLTPFLNDDMPVWFKEEVTKKNCMVKNYISNDFLNNLYANGSRYSNKEYLMWIVLALNRWLEKNI